MDLYKRQLEKTRIDLINCMVDKIGDQFDSCTLCRSSVLLTWNPKKWLLSKDFSIVQHIWG